MNKTNPVSADASQQASSICVKNLTRYFGSVAAIHKLSFNVYPGEIIGFLGPNGAGKSTTMRILSGILSASSGSAWVNGVCVAQNPHEVKRRIGYMPENNPLPKDMRVAEYLRFRAHLKKVPSRKVRQSVEKTMEICDLARTARRKIIGTLSKGFRQRVGIADALLGSPEVIIMDEPTIGLDPHQIQGIRKLIDDLRGHLTLILSSHILPEIERCCDRVIIINQGRIVASGTSQSLREEFLPAQRYKLELTCKKDTVEKILQNNKIAAKIVQLNPSDGGTICLLLETESHDPLGEHLIQIFNKQEDCRLHSLAPHNPTLEEIFLAATKRSWEETMDTNRIKSLDSK